MTDSMKDKKQNVEPQKETLSNYRYNQSSQVLGSMRAYYERAYTRAQQSNAALQKVSLNTSKGLIHIDVDIDLLISRSYSASKQQEEVPITPYMKNALQKYDKLGDKRLKYWDPITAAEKYIQAKVAAKLKELYGPETKEYDRSLPILDVRHYAVDNYRNFKTGIAMRDIQPGQQRQREEGFATFREPAVHTPNIFNDKYVGIAVSSVLADMPHKIVASTKFEDWAGPFENKHTQTSWPFGYKDDVVISATNDTTGVLKPFYGMTYGQLCVDIAEHTPLDQTLEMTVNMGYGRNQRGKGRPLIAMARIPAISYNRMTKPETEACKTRCPFMVGYNSRVILREVMVRQSTLADQNNWGMENFDYHAFDQTISPEWLGLGGAAWNLCAADDRSRQIVDARTVYGMQGLLIDGIAPKDKRIADIHGRMFSGFIETNKTENVINATATTAVMLQLDSGWINDILRRSPYARIYMGDDCLITYNKDKFSHDKYVKYIANYGFEVHPDKGEYGAFFLQNRLFRDDDGFTFTYPWTRVLRSLMFKEQTRGLGPAGWTLAAYSQLANIREYKEGLAFVRDLLIEFDEYGLMLDQSIKSIIRQVQEEDAEALKENKRAQSTWDIINDGDPGKAQMSSGDPKYLAELQRDIKAA